MNKRRTTLIVSGLLVLVGGASLLAPRYLPDEERSLERRSRDRRRP